MCSAVHLGDAQDLQTVTVHESCIALTQWLADQTAGPNGPDWSAVLRMAETHQIAPYVYRGVTESRHADVPPEVMSRLEESYGTSARRNTILRDELLVVLERLRQEGIEIIPYKEPLVFSISCSDIGMRQFKDIDFLVAADDLDGISTVLKRLGYRLEQAEKWFLHPGFERLDKDYSFIRDTAWTTRRPLPDSQDVDHPKFGRVLLEPHWSITHPRLGVDLSVQALRSRTRAVRHCGGYVNVLSAEDVLVVACIVGSKSEWRSLKLVADVAQAIESAPDLNWAECLERATEARARRMFLVGSLLARKISGASVPESVERAAMCEPSVEKLVGNILEDLGSEAAATRVDPRRLSFRMLRLREPRKDQLISFVETVTAPSRLEMRLIPVPRQLRFVLRFFVPFLRYAALPIARPIRQLFRRIGNGRGKSSKW